MTCWRPSPETRSRPWQAVAATAPPPRRRARAACRPVPRVATRRAPAARRRRPSASGQRAHARAARPQAEQLAKFSTTPAAPAAKGGKAAKAPKAAKTPKVAPAGGAVDFEVVSAALTKKMAAGSVESVPFAAEQGIEHMLFVDKVMKKLWSAEKIVYEMQQVRARLFGAGTPA